MLELDEGSPLEMLRQFAVDLNADLREDFGAAKLILDNELGKGTISLYELFPGLAAWVYDIEFNEDYAIELSFTENGPYYFGYHVKGHQLQSFSYEDAPQKVSQGQNFILISTGKTDTHSNFVIPGKMEYQSCFIIISPQLLKKHKTKIAMDLKSNLKSFFSEVETAGPYRYFGDIDARTGLFAELLVKNQRTDLVGRLLTEGAVLNMLASELEAHHHDVSSDDDRPDLTKAELSRITSLGDYIRENIDTDMTIKDLWQHVGLSPKKLQSGIQFLYGYTANQYLTNVRLELSKELLLTTEMHIAEISDRIGYSSKSYFSKMFKERFGFLPKDIKNSHDNGKLLFEITYRSMAKDDISDAEIKEIIALARKANRRYDITGSLIFHRKVFFQLIEGPRESVLKLYDNIQKDQRHFDVNTMWQGSKPARDFGQWDMAMLADSGILDISYDGDTKQLNLGHLMGNLDQQSLMSQNLWRKVRNIIKTSRPSVN